MKLNLFRLHRRLHLNRRLDDIFRTSSIFLLISEKNRLSTVIFSSGTISDMRYVIQTGNGGHLQWYGNAEKQYNPNNERIENKQKHK